MMMRGRGLLYGALVAFGLLLRSGGGAGLVDFLTGGGKDVGDDPNDPLAEYGVDVSFPIHHYLNPKSANPTRRHFATRYDNTMAGCYATYTKHECDGNEHARIDMNLNQPRSQHNYTEMGFKKMRIPDALWKNLQVFWDENKDKERLENWPRGNTYVNHWSTPSYMVSTGERSLRLQHSIHEEVVKAMQGVLEEWTGKKLTHTSLYGIRVYKHGSILATHVDRLPLVTSAILQIAQDINEPWPVEVYSHAGKAYNVSMKPGDMVLYESHSVLHGRPHPLNGTFYANIFVHFIPVDHEEENERDRVQGKVLPIPPDADCAEAARRQMQKQTQKGKPRPGKNEVGHEAQNHDDEVVKKHIDRNRGSGGVAVDGQTALHRAASKGQLDVVEKLLSQSSDLLQARDANDWQAIHEAARSGHVDIVEYLVQMGADLGARTSNGGTALFWARAKLPAGHAVIKYLEGIGAPDSEDFAGKE